MLFKKNKRVISFVLVLLMIFTTMPIDTFASDVFINSGFSNSSIGSSANTSGGQASYSEKEGGYRFYIVDKKIDSALAPTDSSEFVEANEAVSGVAETGSRGCQGATGTCPTGAESELSLPRTSQTSNTLSKPPLNQGFSPSPLCLIPFQNHQTRTFLKTLFLIYSEIILFFFLSLRKINPFEYEIIKIKIFFGGMKSCM